MFEQGEVPFLIQQVSRFLVRLCLTLNVLLKYQDAFDILQDNTECTLEISFGDDRGAGGPLKGSRGSTTEREKFSYSIDI